MNPCPDCGARFPEPHAATCRRWLLPLFNLSPAPPHPTASGSTRRDVAGAGGLLRRPATHEAPERVPVPLSCGCVTTVRVGHDGRVRVLRVVPPRGHERHLVGEALRAMGVEV